MFRLKKYYLILLLFIIMGAGARTLFEIAYHGAGREHGFAPQNDTQQLMLLTVWFVEMMIADVILIRHKEIAYRNLFIVLLTIGVLAPILYKLSTT
jgi:hypothetical protein